MTILNFFIVLLGLVLGLTGAQVSQQLVDEHVGIEDHEGPPEWSEKMEFRQSYVEPMGSMVREFENI